MKTLFEQTQQVTAILSHLSIDGADKQAYAETLERISSIMNCHFYLLDTAAKNLVADDRKRASEKVRVLYPTLAQSEAVVLLNEMQQAMPSEPFETSNFKNIPALQERFSDPLITMVPLYGNQRRQGSLFVGSQASIELAQATLLEVIAAILGLQLSFLQHEETEKSQRDTTIVKLVQSLSHSELETFKTIVQKIEL